MQDEFSKGTVKKMTRDDVDDEWKCIDSLVDENITNAGHTYRALFRRFILLGV